MGLTTGFIDGSTGVDIGAPLVEKSYMIDRYGELNNTFKQAGLWLWGYNYSGQLGDNTGGFSSNIAKSSPVQTISGGLNWELVSGGGYHTAAIKTDGSLWLWGLGTSGQLGNNAQTSRSSPVQTISGGTNWKQVSSGSTQTAAIKTDGSLWLWGNNYYGQLGTNNTTNRSSPVQTVSGGTNWKFISCGDGHSAAIKTDGTLWLWGFNIVGQLGNNAQVDRSSPVQTISGGTNWQQVSCGNGTTGAIKTDGTLWLWGSSSFGQLGNNAQDSVSSPIQTVSGGTNWKQVICSYNSPQTAAIKTDGTLWLWGRGDNGALGNNAQGDRSSPVQTVSGGTNWKEVSCGFYCVGAIKTDGTLWIWGNNANGQLGTNDQGNRSSPVQTISGGTNWKSISAGNSFTAAIRDEEY